MEVFDSLTERQIYEVQVDLRAVKQCTGCHRTLTMGKFYPPSEIYGTCQKCRRCIDRNRAWDRAHPRRMDA